MRKLTVGKDILKSLKKSKRPVTDRRLAGWYPRYSFSSVYQILHRFKKQGLVEENAGLFSITAVGIKKLQEAN